jgi:uncharacterized protein (TIGR02246 family)
MDERHDHPRSPEALMRSFSDRVDAGDLDGLVSLYEPDAVFEPEPGTVVHGVDEIRAALAVLLALRPTMTTEIAQVLVSGDIALVVNEWSMTGTGPDGSTVHQGGRSADVVRRGADGAWRVVVDKP